LASEDDVLALWQGLGYYSRARNLHHTARIVAQQYFGKFPDDYNKLLQLKGIGSYTAAAIASMAFGLPHAAVDGNVTRVIARYFGIEEPVNDSNIKKLITQTANDLIDKSNPGDFNQAMMDFGSMICKPTSPDCHICPFNQECRALMEDKIDYIPLKNPKNPRKTRYFHFFLISCPVHQPLSIYIEKREKNDIWKNLYQLPLLETQSGQFDKNLLRSHPVLKNLSDSEHVVWEMDGMPYYLTHQLTHQRIEAAFYKIRLGPTFCSIFDSDFIKVNLDDFEGMGKPVLISRYLEKFGDPI
jgi:A/G-specific adenine glycosylase